MKTYYYKCNSFAAPFCSDTSRGKIKAEEPMEALRKVVENYSHGMFEKANKKIYTRGGLYSAAIFDKPETFYDKEPDPVARYLSWLAVTQDKYDNLEYVKDGVTFEGEYVREEERFELLEKK